MYLRGTPSFQHHVDTYGPQAEFGYKDFIPMMKGERFDPAVWARLFKDSGARFVVPVAEHHDGFAMYDCSLSEWNAARMGPCRDIAGELSQAVRREGLVFGASSHRAEHWFYFEGGRQFDSDVQDPKWGSLYGPARPRETQPDQAFLEDWLARTCEIIDKYRPQLLWFDWWIEEPAFAPYLRKLTAYYYNRAAEWKVGVAINFKYEAFPPEAAVFDVERGQLKGIRPLYWQNDTSVSKNSWCFIRNHDYKSTGSIIADLVDVVSKNGALLLNVGPRPDGTIAEREQEMLREIGAWLALNGEAIHETRPWKIFGEGPTEIPEGAFSDTQRSDFTPEDIRFTVNGDTLYAISLAWPDSGELTVKTMATGCKFAPLHIASVELIGAREPLLWTRDAAGLHIVLPSTKPCEHAYVFRISGRWDV